MLGLIMTLFSAGLLEAGIAIGKQENSKGREGIYSMGFLNMVAGATFVVAVGLLTPGGFHFDPSSLPTVLVRAALELVLAYIGLRAIVEADRSTLSFLATLSIPLLLTIDLFLGYSITLRQTAGVAAIVLALVLLYVKKGLRSEGSRLAIMVAVLATATISLYQYNIRNFNSVAFEQTYAHILLLTYFFVMSLHVEKRNPFSLFSNRRYVLQSTSAGFGILILSYAYLLAPSSIITAAKRAFSLLASIVSGATLFHERHIGLKLASMALVIIGLALLIP